MPAFPPPIHHGIARSVAVARALQSEAAKLREENAADWREASIEPLTAEEEVLKVDAIAADAVMEQLPTEE